MYRRRTYGYRRSPGYGRRSYGGGYPRSRRYGGMRGRNGYRPTRRRFYYAGSRY